LNFEHDYGKNTVFMMWNAGVIVLETLIGNARIFSWIKNNLPKPLVTILVICTAMPVAHWFLHPYTKSTLFVHGELAVPMIKIMVEE
jgi:predicted permease